MESPPLRRGSSTSKEDRSSSRKVEEGIRKYRKRYRMLHVAAVLAEQRRLKQQQQQGDPQEDDASESSYGSESVVKGGGCDHTSSTKCDCHDALCEFARRSSDPSRRHAETIARYDAVMGYRPPSSFADIVNVIFASVLFGES